MQFWKVLLPTWGFVQVWLEVVAIIINNIAAFVRAGQTSLNISSYYLSLSKAKQRFRADGILMPHLLQSPNVGSNFTMTLTPQRFKTIFYIVLGLCILTMVLSATSFDFVEVDTAVSWTMKYFALPILIIMIPSCYFIYLKFIIQHETKTYKSKVWTNLRTIFRIFILTIAMTGIFIGTTLSLIILTNAFLGDSKQINLNAKIVDYYTIRNNKGQTKFHIKIQDNQIDRIVELKVYKPYEIGQQFTKTMNIGMWGLLYSRE